MELNHTRILLRGLALGLVASVAPVISSLAEMPDVGDTIRTVAASRNKFWGQVSDSVRDNPSPRDFFLYALTLCEANQHPERLFTLFNLAKRMQDHDPKSKHYGNFRWNWNDATVLDQNAVEFCMQSAALIWIRHKDAIPPEARVILQGLLEPSVVGCLNHKVKPAYTNIALMNATNLTLLGEALGKPDVAEEGYRRFDSAEQFIRENGIGEYGSPTYYGVDLNDLLLFEAFAQREGAVRQARSLLELFWTDIALNWFEPAQRYAGANSRTYDFLHGHGELDTHLWLNGWLAATKPPGPTIIFGCLGRWKPPVPLRELSLNSFPRTVCQTWGNGPNDVRTHFLTRDVTLGSSGANYGNMDMPLTFDLPGPRSLARGYFIPDGRHDPYGRLKVSERNTGHDKAVHLKPFFAAAQNEGDVLALVVYRDSDIPAGTKTLESHFVLPFGVGGLFVGERAVVLPIKQWSVDIGSGEAICLRSGSAGIGIRIIWARGWDGGPAPVSLVCDDESPGTIRLTVNHRIGEGAIQHDAAAAAFWVRVGSGLSTAEAFAEWRRVFAEEKFTSNVTPDSLEFSCGDPIAPIGIKAESPFKAAATLSPRITRPILSLNGEELGRKLFEK